MSQKTSVVFNDELQQITLTCDEKLWKLINDLKKKGVQNLDIMAIAKIYKEIKSLDLNLNEKENENAENKS